MRASWHAEGPTLVLSLWHADECVGTVRLDTPDATRLAGYLVGHLGRQAER